MKTPRLYPSAPLENIHADQRLQKKLNDVNSFSNSINSIKEIITYLEDKTQFQKEI